jgi:hypothetical protein
MDTEALLAGSKKDKDKSWLGAGYELQAQDIFFLSNPQAAVATFRTAKPKNVSLIYPGIL